MPSLWGGTAESRSFLEFCAPSGSRKAPVASVIIPTRDRPDQLRQCLRAIEVSVAYASEEVEVIVVDDGSNPPLRRDALPLPLRIVLLRLEGAGPAAARNAGIANASGPVLVFTDDDTVPAPSWIATALCYLERHPAAVGVEGPVSSPDWDRLVESSIRTTGPGHYLTCNVAYRRNAIAEIGGFKEDVFRFAHAEDLDLAARLLRVGKIGFAAEMTVEHTPRALTLKHVVRQAQWVRDDIALLADHPHIAHAFRLPIRLALIWGNTSQWLIWAANGDRRSLRRWSRAVCASILAGAVATWTALVAPPAAVLRRRSNAG